MNVVIDVGRWPAAVSDGYRVETRIVVWEEAGTTIVPVTALFREQGSWAVFVLARGRAMLRNVRIGERTADGAQVLDGLVAGDRVVLFPSDQISPGRRVSLIR